MSTIVYRISVLLSAIFANVPVGTNLGLFWLLWALISRRFLLSRGAVFPALADGGLPHRRQDRLYIIDNEGILHKVKIFPSR